MNTYKTTARIVGIVYLETMGSGLGLASSIPGGLWEVFTGVWLIAKGFNSSAFVSGTVLD